MRRIRPHNEVVAVLGNGLNEQWQLPAHVKSGLLTAAELYRDRTTSRIAVTGKWSINWDKLGITPPVTEAGRMKEFLEGLGVPSRNILVENESKDTIGNAYFLKTRYFQPQGIKNFLIICADFQVERAQFIFDKVFGDGYAISFLPMATELGKQPEVRTSQQEIFERQKQFLAPMKRGDDTFLRNRLYQDEFYGARELNTAAYVAMGRRI